MFKKRVCSPWTSASDQGKYGPLRRVKPDNVCSIYPAYYCKMFLCTVQFPEILPIITVCVREVYLIKPKDKDYFS